MNVFAIAALAAVGYLGVSSTVHAVKKVNHKIASVVSKPFHHKKVK